MTDWLRHLLGKDWPMTLWAGAAFFALFIYPIYDFLMVRRHLARVGRTYCESHGYIFDGIGHAKSHFSVIYKTPGSGKRRYARFVLRTSLGRFRDVKWLE